ncbi:hypothetical protein PZA11_000748 [Diplocarpon coronariae]|uniref:Uncharacterized protein n=1 Tax=Diplocarpon coronariae TaxID=2795749 RepID=A0A218ZCH7_9HELO|nr:hypothetical protein JHW43_004602 [Diplocarpon mali]OWP04975.1 hypothetical protein B2J93_7276 [Marssonina coronariae]
MAPRQLRTVQRQEEDSEEDSSQQASQEDPFDVVRRAQELVKAGEVRREKKRRSIEGEFEKRVDDARAKIDTLFASRKSRVTKSRELLWTRLDTLNKKREGIERLILASMRTLEYTSINTSNDLEIVLEGRIEELEQQASVKDT